MRITHALPLLSGCSLGILESKILLLISYKISGAHKYSVKFTGPWNNFDYLYINLDHSVNIVFHSSYLWYMSGLNCRNLDVMGRTSVKTQNDINVTS